MAPLLKVFLIFYLPALIYTCADAYAADPEIYMNAKQIIESKGYRAEEYIVKTSDGYYLTLQRILPKPGVKKARRNVVLLQHGLVDSAHTWINNLANQSLGFIMADNGFDVWLSNSRGSTYSQSHENLDPDAVPFWEFSWDEMAQYDLPAEIYFILKVTTTDKVFYVGHSQGTEIFFARMNQDADLRSKIAAFGALAPVAYLGSVKSPLRYLVPFCKTLTTAKHFVGVGRFLASDALMQFLGYFLCEKDWIPFVCRNIVFLIAGYNPKHMNETRLPVYVSHTPAGTSVQNMVHYCQSISSDRFQHFDFGRQENQRRYNQSTPPRYGLSHMDVPTTVYWGGLDVFATPTDVRRLLNELPRGVESLRDVYIPSYTHLDFVWGIDAA